MAISIISVFSTRPRPFLMYCDGIKRERSARHAKMFQLKFSKRGRRRNFTSLTIHPVTSPLFDDSVTQRVLLLIEKGKVSMSHKVWVASPLFLRIWGSTWSARVNLAENDSSSEECNTLQNDASKELKITALHPSKQPQTSLNSPLKPFPFDFLQSRHRLRCN